jgi:hypothetical protein
MRKALVATAVCLAALAACNRKPPQAPRPPAPPRAPPTSQAAPAVAPAALPERTPGLWEQKVSTAGRSQVSRVCLDQAAERQFTWWGEHAGEGACSRTKLTPHAGGGWEFASACDMGEGGKSAIRGQVTGDLAKAYKVSAQSTISHARAPSMNGTHAMTLEASWQGPCPANMHAGDVVLPGGVKINMMEIPGR